MKINYCLPIIKKTKSEVLQTIEMQKNEYQYFEVWLDGVEEIDNIFINKLITLLPGKLILLFQRGVLNSGIDKEKKLQILDLLHNTQTIIDLDISEIDELAYLQKNKIKVKTIISYHNYQETPLDLSKIIQRIEKLHPAILKIATFCKNENDALRLLQLLLVLQKQKKQYIILGMGEFGTITRVFGTVWGNALNYAPITRREESAPGQLTKQELDKIFTILVTKN